MNGQPYGRFPSVQQQQQQQQQQQNQQSNSYPFNTSPYSTVQYSYPGIPQIQQQQPQPQYFQPLPQSTPSSQRRQTPRALRQPAQRQSDASFQDNRIDPSSLPASPGNGPGAPPAERNSPPPSFEDQLLSALHNDGNAGEAASGRLAPDEDDDDDQDVINTDEPVYQLPPPPESEYVSEAELEKAIHAWSMEHGYELVRRASKKNASGQLYKRYYHCSKHGRGNSGKTPEKDKVRVNRQSQRIGCPMSLAAVSVNPHDPSGAWQIRLRKTHHNHPAVEATELAGHRRRARLGAVENAVDGLFAINTSTSDVLKFLQRTHPEGLFKRTDVANMKLKYKKYGTCAHHPERPQHEVGFQAAPSAAQKITASACNSCRSKKTKCDSGKPKCESCVKSGIECVYAEAPNVRSGKQQQQPLPPAPATSRTQQNATPSSSARSLGQATASSSQVDPMQIDSASFSFDLTGANADSTPSVSQPDQAAQVRQEVFAAIQAFQQEHIKPVRLDLNSSAVEVLASSTCGNGDTYRSTIHQPFNVGDDWRRFKDSFEGAAVRENCLDVLLGHKKEPERPNPATGDSFDSVGPHNEYIKQLAIFKRRNEMLKLGLSETLSPALWNRFRSLRYAFEIWSLLEDMCCPRGSEHAYARFNDIFMITLAGCGGNLDNYINALEHQYSELNDLAAMHESRRINLQFGVSAAEAARRKGAPNTAVTEDTLCLLFLRNLGPQYQNIATNMCKKNNIGGFGTGERCTFKDLYMQVKRSLDR